MISSDQIMITSDPIDITSDPIDNISDPIDITSDPIDNISDPIDMQVSENADASDPVATLGDKTCGGHHSCRLMQELRGDIGSSPERSTSPTVRSWVNSNGDLNIAGQGRTLPEGRLLAVSKRPCELESEEMADESFFAVRSIPERVTGEKLPNRTIRAAAGGAARAASFLRKQQKLTVRRVAYRTGVIFFQRLAAALAARSGAFDERASRVSQI